MRNGKSLPVLPQGPLMSSFDNEFNRHSWGFSHIPGTVPGAGGAETPRCDRELVPVLPELAAGKQVLSRGPL